MCLQKETNNPWSGKHWPVWESLHRVMADWGPIQWHWAYERLAALYLNSLLLTHDVHLCLLYMVASIGFGGKSSGVCALGGSSGGPENLRGEQEKDSYSRRQDRGWQVTAPLLNTSRLEISSCAVGRILCFQMWELVSLQGLGTQILKAPQRGDQVKMQSTFHHRLIGTKYFYT